MNRKILVIASALGLMVAFVAAVLIYNEKQEAAARQLAEVNRAALMRMHAPTLGKQDAPVVIVEFLDPACETCRAFYPLVKEMMAANPDKIRLVLRYAPFHNGSDKVVAVLEAARKQGKFWPTLEALLASQAEWAPHHTPQVALVWKHLEGVGLNMEQMAFDLTAPEIEQVIAQDLADARVLNVTKTPGFFVNDKPLTTFGYEPLKKLVNDALSETLRR
ncbi:MAG: thioredoxin domain-containing protein [Rhodocyclales bacterium]|jgi:protein-disulfide isomerase|nr:thioredoxin domain-containing protein [Rhodocyclales bacterium]